MFTTTRINVDGMSCGQCVTSARNEAGKLAGVDVDLTAGTVQVTSDAPLDEVDVNAAIDEVGRAVTP